MIGEEKVSGLKNTPTMASRNRLRTRDDLFYDPVGHSVKVTDPADDSVEPAYNRVGQSAERHLGGTVAYNGDTALPSLTAH